MKRFIVLAMFVGLFGCTKEVTPEPVAESATSTYTLEPTRVSSGKTSNKLDDILKRFDSRNQDLQQQQQISKESGYDTSQYREVTRLNNVIIDLRIENDTLREENSMLNAYLSADIDRSSQKGLRYTEDELLAERTRIRIYDLILMYNIISTYSPFIADDVASDRARYDMLNIRWELENYGITDVDDILLDEFDLDELVQRGNAYAE